uniref:Uncharacterized protein n=1 Tax=Clastoptera arizonana TaxID=38151 RepID=A0A1B6D036_9HEMI
MIVFDKFLAYESIPGKHYYICRKRSDGRLKNSSSCTDVRIWSLDAEERRKAFLDIFRGCSRCPPLRHVPIFNVFGAVNGLAPQIKEIPEEDSTFVRFINFIFDFFERKENEDSVNRNDKTSFLYKVGQKLYTMIFGSGSGADLKTKQFRRSRKKGYKRTGFRTINESETFDLNEQTSFELQSNTIRHYKRDDYTESVSAKSYISFTSDIKKRTNSSSHKFKVVPKSVRSQKLVTYHGHTHSSSEDCQETCHYLREKLRNYYEICFQRDLFLKKLEYHDKHPITKRMINKLKYQVLNGVSKQSGTTIGRSLPQVSRNVSSTYSQFDIDFEDFKKNLLSISKVKVNTPSNSRPMSKSDSQMSLSDARYSKYQDLKDFDKFISGAKKVVSEMIRSFELLDEYKSDETLMRRLEEREL